MEKNLAKTYNPKDFEDRIYEMWETNGAFRAEVNPDKKTIHNRNAAAQYYRTAAYGTCPGSDTAGCSDKMEKNARLQCVVASGF